MKKEALLGLLVSSGGVEKFTRIRQESRKFAKGSLSYTYRPFHPRESFWSLKIGSLLLENKREKSDRIGICDLWGFLWDLDMGENRSFLRKSAESKHIRIRDFCVFCRFLRKKAHLRLLQYE